MGRKKNRNPLRSYRISLISLVSVGRLFRLLRNWLRTLGIARSDLEGLVAAICCGEVGAVVASRLARNGRDWRVRGARSAPADWMILIRDRHDGYIDWDTYDRNQRMIAGDANM